ncbi:Gfo/Idh/MocA family oxidoreductase [Microbacterium thalassium]|uniref:Gfo/Idh/MocA family protein n=1 Tax=Microbacterium TaxID=33882 RepID=UPI00146CB2D4|nr:Gfo/Idh/MocA family oxidoreductase [Microbacterium thalassium]
MIRIGIIGSGWILSAHLQGIADLVAAGVDVRIGGICTRRPESILPLWQERSEWPIEFASRATAMPHLAFAEVQADPVALWDDYGGMIASGDVDAVLDLTPPFLHHRVGHDVLSAGLHLLTEKPLGLTVRTASTLVATAIKHDRVLGVAETVRCMDEVQVERQVISSGGVGILRQVSWNNVGGAWAPDRVVAGTTWRHRRRYAGGGTTLDNGVHYVDWLRYTVGEVVSVVARTKIAEPIRYTGGGGAVAADVDDVLQAVLSFENGVVGSLSSSWATSGGGEPQPTYRGSLGEWSGHPGEAPSGPRLEGVGLLRENTFANPFAEQIYRWLGAIGGEGKVAVTGEEGLRDVAVCMALLESSHVNAWVDVDDVLRGRVNAYQAEIDEFHLGPPA